MENKWQNKKFGSALKNAINGIKYTLKTQRNLKIQIVFAVLAWAFGFLFRFHLTEFAILTITIFSVLFAEFVNTAIETVVDLCTEEYHEKAKIAKDVAASAVTIMAINSVVVGILLFGPRVINLLL